MIYIHGNKNVTKFGFCREEKSMCIKILYKNNDTWQDKITAMERYKGSVLLEAKEESHHF
jgi:hypothetical protein